MAYRYLYNAGFLGVPTVFFDFFSRSYPLNYLVMFAAVGLSELIMLLVYSTSLCQIKVEETLEGIDGFKLVHTNNKTKSLLGQCDIKKTQQYLTSSRLFPSEEKLTITKAESSKFLSNFYKYPVIEFQDDITKRA